MTNATTIEDVSITVRSATPPLNVRGSDVYFSFGNGRLAYDCPSCGALCCRGHGYRLQAGVESTEHFRTSPLSRFFAEPADRGRTFLLRNLPSGCFYLTTENKCRLHESFGGGAKPETCRLFPFNHIRRHRQFLIVCPHLSLCPLSVTADDPSPVSDHAFLVREMAQRGLSVDVPETSSIGGESVDVISLERAIVRASDDWLNDADPLRWAAAQLRITESVIGRRSDPAMTNESATMMAFSSAVRSIIGGSSQTRRD